MGPTYIAYLTSEGSQLVHNSRTLFCNEFIFALYFNPEKMMLYSYNTLVKQATMKEADCSVISYLNSGKSLQYLKIATSVPVSNQSAIIATVLCLTSSCYLNNNMNNVSNYDTSFYNILPRFISPNCSLTADHSLMNLKTILYIMKNNHYFHRSNVFSTLVTDLFNHPDDKVNFNNTPQALKLINICDEILTNSSKNIY